MPTQKDFKRVVRRRMQKTGESYAAARAQLLHSPTLTPSRPPSAKRPARRPSTEAQTYAKLAGMSDAAVKAATGCTWERWVRALDRAQAHTWPHRKIAAYVHEKYQVPSWWTQTVTVGYERIRGLREVGQRRDGGYVVSKSKTFPVPVSELYAAFAVVRRRARWLSGVSIQVRTAKPNTWLRLTWEDGTRVLVSFIAKGAAKSAAQVEHGRLPDKASVARTKQYWAERLESLGTLLEPTR